MTTSRASSYLNIPSPSQNRSGHQISLLDRSISQASIAANDHANTEGQSSDTSKGTRERVGLYRRVTNNSQSLGQSVRREIARQKYSKYSQTRYDTEQQEPAESGEEQPSRPSADRNLSRQKSYLNRAQARAKDILQRKSTLGQRSHEVDTAVDILYENQRGIFFFGIPKYSANSLLPSDPKPWQNGQFRTSASDIRNAQVPDPSWEWAWKNWYVDMSRDVDEEGWEYSFAFVGKQGEKFAWHGNHPWFHSFVRRRRWLRMRRRRDLNVHKTSEPAHELNAEYFTIHPTDLRPSSINGSQDPAAMLSVIARARDAAFDVETMEISTIGDLFLALRTATVDREKLLAVRRFIDEGGPELHYLSERMPDIMAMMVFQSSRRQLLRDLTDRHDELHTDQTDLAEHDHTDDPNAASAHDRNTARAAHLLAAVHAADDQVKHLEYWSDIKSTSSPGNMPTISDSEKSTNTAEPIEVDPPDLEDLSKPDPPISPPRRTSTTNYDTQSKTSKGAKSVAESGEESGFVTPAESVGELKRRFKGKGREKGKGGKLGREDKRFLDGVDEELEHVVEDEEGGVGEGDDGERDVKAEEIGQDGKNEGNAEDEKDREQEKDGDDGGGNYFGLNSVEPVAEDEEEKK